MRKVFFADLTNAIKAMHYRHGRGDIKAIRRYGDGRVEVDAQRTSCKPETRKGRIVAASPWGKHVIRMYGRQFTVHITG